MTQTFAKQDVVPDPSVAEADLIALVRELVSELRGERGGPIAIRAASRLERDLGIDSLGRTELMLRIEQRFAIRLDVSAMGEADTVGDLLKVLNQNKPTRAPSASLAVTPALPQVQAATHARTLLEVLDWHATQHP